MSDKNTPAPKHHIRKRLAIFPRIFWPIMVIFLLVAYRILGLEGESVLLGLSCRNAAYLIIAVFMIRYAIRKRKEKTFFPLGLAALIPATFLLGAFMYLQANVILDLIVVPRETTLSQCRIREFGPESIITGFTGEIRGINTNDYEKRLPMTGFQEELIKEELDHYKNVNLAFYEHVRRIVVIRTRYYNPDLTLDNWDSF